MKAKTWIWVGVAAVVVYGIYHYSKKPAQKTAAPVTPEVK